MSKHMSKHDDHKKKHDDKPTDEKPATTTPPVCRRCNGVGRVALEPSLSWKGKTSSCPDCG